MIEKIVIANRGEIAVRIIRSCREMGIRSVALFSEADRMSKHVMLADEAYPIGPAPSKESYLDVDKIIETALKCGADAVHPGYGFLSENAGFARKCEVAGITFIGPRAETIERMGDKISARRSMTEAGVPVVPGIQRQLESATEAERICREIGLPVILKAASGGGGKGMRLIRSESEIGEAYAAAKSEALSSFGDETVYIEKYIEEPHHIEFQILGDAHGNIVHLYDRECSVHEDIDRTCCLMTVCNFLIHGCVGEVIWHDSLNPDTYYDGWKVNERLAITGLPTIRRIAKEESVVWRTWQNQRDDAKGHVITPIKKINIRKKREEAKRMQLDLFD